MDELVITYATYKPASKCQLLAHPNTSDSLRCRIHSQEGTHPQELNAKDIRKKRKQSFTVFSVLYYNKSYYSIFLFHLEIHVLIK